MITKSAFIKLGAIVARAKVAEDAGRPWTSDAWIQWFQKSLFIENVKFSPEKFELTIKEFYNEFKQRSENQTKG
jgi:hypothetical protein